jgi:hypothetical protein
MSALRLAVRLGAITVTATALILPAAAVATATTATPAHKGILPPKEPSRSLPPRPFFLSSSLCAHGNDGQRCNSQILKATTRARKILEKMSGMKFALAAYDKLTPIEQLFVTVNLERTARGLAPAVVLTRSLDKVAQEGASKDEDPPLQDLHNPLPGGGRWIGLGGNWAGGWDNALGSNYAWVYDDGAGSDNGDCTKTNKSGCWGHRNNILGTFSTNASCGGQQSELALGAGHVTNGKAFGDSETELMAGVCGPTPTDVVISWARAKKLLHIK